MAFSVTHATASDASFSAAGAAAWDAAHTLTNIARTDAAQTFTGDQTITGNVSISTNGASFQWSNANNNVALNGVSGDLVIYTGTAGYVEHARITGAGILSVTGGAYFGTAALATSATTGYVYIQTCAGAPTGVPDTRPGQVAIHFDTTNNKLYIYDGGWLSTPALT